MIPRRSVLYLPGANTRALSKARTLPCDTLILDLEDAVATNAKSTARERLAEAVREGGYAYRELVVRVNGLDTPWGRDDIAMAVQLQIDAVLFPKINSETEARAAVAALDAAGASTLPAWFMIETPRGVLNVASIAGASKRVDALVLGTSDLVKELRARHTTRRDNLSFALQSCVMAARASGIDVLDGVHLEFRDLESFREACSAGRDMGFDGKTLIHPAQIEIANDIFGPDTNELAFARRVLETWTAAQANGSGVVELDGQLIENLHAAEAERVLNYAAALAARTR